MHLFSRMWLIYCVIILTLIVLTFLIPYLILLKTNISPAGAHNLRKWNCRLLLFLCGVRLQVFNKEHFPAKDEAVIYCPNHASYLDILTGLAVFPGNFGFVGKEELTKNPFLKLFFGKTDITVRRANVVHSAKALESSGKFLNKGWSIVIFPEGGIKDNVPAISPFKSGAFRLSVEMQKKIVPVTFADNYRLLPTDKFLARPGRCRVYIHPPLSPEQNNYSEKELKEKTYNIIKNQLNQSVFNENR